MTHDDERPAVRLSAAQVPHTEQSYSGAALRSPGAAPKEKGAPELKASARTAFANAYLDAGIKICTAQGPHPERKSVPGLNASARTQPAIDVWDLFRV